MDQDFIADEELTPFTGKPCNHRISLQHTSNVSREKVGHITVKHKSTVTFFKRTIVFNVRFIQQLSS